MRLIDIRRLVLTGLWLSASSSFALFATAILWHFDNAVPALAATQISSQPEDNHKHLSSIILPELHTVESAPHILEIKEVAPLRQKEMSHNTGEGPIKPETPRVSIIIDDLGYQWSSGLHSIQLEGDYTLAILPFSPYSTQLALEATKSNKEIMLHAPMEPIAYHSWEKHLGLDVTMNQNKLQTRLSLMLQDVPNAKGINNHMGSLLTQDKEAMNWIMEDISARNLYFIDSLTTSLSYAYAAAQSHNIPSRKRDVFLDNTRTHEAIAIQFEKLLKQAKKNGSAVGIGHPYPETIAFLQGAASKYKEHNVDLVPITTLLSMPVKENSYTDQTKRLAQTPTL